MGLKQRILDKRNIYAAIYGMESFVFDKGLLDTEKTVQTTSGDTIAANDLELYYRLSDKYNIPLIEQVVEICEKRLTSILFNKEELFDIAVYFRLKNYEDGKLSYRPLHTARLTDMICMVCILNVLMFDDVLENGKRKLSDLAKLIPHNFFGNIPSTDVQYLFNKWQNKYKEYSENVINHCREYQQNHTYLTEVCLDIKNFFPSISPKWLYSYIVKKMQLAHQDDLDEFKMAVAKLLYFNVQPSNMVGWEAQYYPEGTAVELRDFYMNCGIPQGLPQSYFFGNLCMIEIKNVLMKDDYFQGDAYFYVDDSVIYVESHYDEGAFNDKLKRLNKELEEGSKNQQSEVCDVDKCIAKYYLDFQNRLAYCIQFHEEGKSVATPIDKTDSQYGLIANLHAQTSMSSRILWGLDELDDTISLNKLRALNEVVSGEIEKQALKSPTPRVSSRLKLLRRFKRYFLYRERLLSLREKDDSYEALVKHFKEHFINYDDVEHWFDQADEEIFSAEYRMLIQQGSVKEAKDLCAQIKGLEMKIIKEATKQDTPANPYLYYAKDAIAAVYMKRYTRDDYGYLKCYAKENYLGLKGLDSPKRLNKFHQFVVGLKGNNTLPYTKEDVVLFARKNTPEFDRKIMNAYFSELMSIEPSDTLIFARANARKINYAELRLLAYLRNKQFDVDKFMAFEGGVNKDDVSNQMAIDMGLLSALSIFITYVKEPNRVDDLIRTHQITKGLWYNGSKFLYSYTLHNEEHAVTLINKSVELTNRIDYFRLKETDYFILFLACYLHDISMVIHPDLHELSSVKDSRSYNFISEKMDEMKEEVQKYHTIKNGDARIKEAGNFIVTIFNEVYNYYEENVRSKHAKDSAKFILEQEKSLFKYLEPTLLSFVTRVSESHGADVYEIYGPKSNAKDDVVSLKYLMLLIRLADLQDVANDRVNYYLLRQNLKNLSLTSRFHWISHLITDKIELETQYRTLPTKEEEEMPEQIIIETINLNLFLNFKQQIEVSEHLQCRGCQCHYEPDVIRIEIKGEEKPIYRCGGRCSILCYWMMKKHEYFINELVALKDYLNSVNNSLIKSEINFNIHYANEMKLDPDMFAYIQDYLNIC